MPETSDKAMMECSECLQWFHIDLYCVNVHKEALENSNIEHGIVIIAGADAELSIVEIKSARMLCVIECNKIAIYISTVRGNRPCIPYPWVHLCIASKHWYYSLYCQITLILYGLILSWTWMILVGINFMVQSRDLYIVEGVQKCLGSTHFSKISSYRSILIWTGVWI